MWLVELKLKRKLSKTIHYTLMRFATFVEKELLIPHKSAARALPELFVGLRRQFNELKKRRFIFESFCDTPPIELISERQAATQEHNIGDYWIGRKECSATSSTLRCKLSDMKSFHNFGDESFKMRTAFPQYLWVRQRFVIRSPQRFLLLRFPNTSELIDLKGVPARPFLT
jgi:hypothetical protein